MQVLNVLFKGLLKVSLITDFVAYVKFNALPLVGNVSDMLIKIHSKTDNCAILEQKFINLQMKSNFACS